MPIDFSNVNITIQQFQQIASGGINVGVELKPDLDTFGSVDVIEEITLDLTDDNPRITNVRLGQKIST